MIFTFLSHIETPECDSVMESHWADIIRSPDRRITFFEGSILRDLHLLSQFHGHSTYSKKGVK